MNELLFQFLHSFANHSDFLDALILLLAEVFPYIVVLGVVGFLVLHRHISTENKIVFGFKLRKRELTRAFLTGGLAWLLASGLKIVFAMPRPFYVLSEALPLWFAGGNTFPSGHAAFFMALGVSMYFFHKRFGLVLIFFAISIGLARVMAGLHFPADISAGFALGIIVALLVQYIFKFAIARKSV